MSGISLIEVTTTNILLVVALVKLLERHGALPRGAYAAELEKTLTDPATKDKLSAGAKATFEHALLMLNPTPSQNPES